MKVLIAEDDAVSRTVLRKTVEKLGHECLATEDGLEAWETYQSTPEVDVIISDWMMPNVDGLEFCKRVRGLEREGSATNQMVSDLRLAHTSATNRLANWQVVLASGSSSYQIGLSGGMLRTRTLPDGTEVYPASGGTITVVFKPDGSAAPTGSPITFEVRSARDGNPFHDIGGKAIAA